MRKGKRYFSEKLTAEALKSTGGMMTEAAKKLNISASALTQRVQASEFLKTVREEIEEEAIDFTKGQLMTLIREKHPAAIIFFLKTKAKHHGFAEGGHGKVTIDETANGSRRITVEFVGNDSSAA